MKFVVIAFVRQSKCKLSSFCQTDFTFSSHDLFYILGGPNSNNKNNANLMQSPPT